MDLVTPRILQVRIKSYKSIARARVDLDPFTALVGPNGSGKSNFIDAIAFMHDALAESIEQAFKRRGGIGAVRRRSGCHPTHVGLGFLIQLDGDVVADYAFEIAAEKEAGFRVAQERCIRHPLMGEPETVFEITNGRFTKAIPGVSPKVASDRLMLYAASAIDEFRPIYDFLTSMRYYSIAPDLLRKLQEPDMGKRLASDGGNAAAVLKRLKEESASIPNGGSNYELLCGLLARMVDGIQSVEHRQIGQHDTLIFRQDIGLKHPWDFDALSMSDGTLRAFGVLLALLQPGNHSLIMIEEPESTVNPAVAEVIMNAMINASAQRQVIATTHSPDLLDYRGLSDANIRAFQMQGGRTLIAPISLAERSIIRDRLCTPGELLRQGELTPDPIAAEPGENLDVMEQPDFLAVASLAPDS